MAVGITHLWKGSQKVGEMVASGQMRAWGKREHCTVYLIVASEFLNVNLYLIWKYEYILKQTKPPKQSINKIHKGCKRGTPP